MKHKFLKWFLIIILVMAVTTASVLLTLEFQGENPPSWRERCENLCMSKYMEFYDITIWGLDKGLQEGTNNTIEEIEKIKIGESHISDFEQF